MVVLANHADETYALALFAHGTAGLANLLKERVGDLEELNRAITETRARRSVVDRSWWTRSCGGAPATTGPGSPT